MPFFVLQMKSGFAHLLVVVKLKELEMRLVQVVEKLLPEESDSDFQLALLTIHVCSVVLPDKAILLSDIHKVLSTC